MPKSSFVDFKAIKSAITMEQVLQHYGLLDRFKRSGDSLSGPCPIHKGENPTQFRVSVSKNIWNCFSECKHGGNTLDFITRMEDVSIHAAALKAVEWFNLALGALSANSDHDERPTETPKSEPASPPKPSSKKAVAAPEEKGTPNKPLKFRLDKLEREHPYLAERGLTLETIVDFGAGFCAKGVMAERIAIPIHGRVATTPNALDLLTEEDIYAGLQRHLSGDWGEVEEDDRKANERALIDGSRIWSVYRAENGLKFWIITEADRSATTILLPEDY